MYIILISVVFFGTLLSVLMAPFTKWTSTAYIGGEGYAQAAADTIKAGVEWWNSRANRTQFSKYYDQARRKLDNYETRYGIYQKMLQKSLGGSSALFGPQKTTSTRTSRGVQDTDMLETPEISAETAPMEAMLLKRYAGNVERGASLPPGYAETQAANISGGAQGQLTAERNVAARHGLSGDAAIIGSPSERSRVGDINDVLANMPLLERQMQREDRSALDQYLTGRRGRRTKGRTTSTSSTAGEMISPADINAILDYYGRLRPVDPTIIMPSG